MDSPSHIDRTPRRAGARALRTTGLYAVAVWGGILGAPELLPSFGLEEAVHVRWFAGIALATILPVGLIAWAYERRQGKRRQSRQSPDAESTPTQAMHATVAAAGSPLVVRWRGEVHRFHDDVVIGRAASCGLHLDDPQISRRHAAIEFRQGRWVLRDLDSRNGTRMDGELIDGEAVLGISSRIDLYEGGAPLHVDLDSAGHASPTGNDHPTADESAPAPGSAPGASG